MFILSLSFVDRIGSLFSFIASSFTAILDFFSFITIDLFNLMSTLVLEMPSIAFFIILGVTMLGIVIAIKLWDLIGI